MNRRRRRRRCRYYCRPRCIRGRARVTSAWLALITHSALCLCLCLCLCPSRRVRLRASSQFVGTCPQITESYPTLPLSLCTGFIPAIFCNSQPTLFALSPLTFSSQPFAPALYPIYKCLDTTPFLLLPLPVVFAPQLATL